MPNETIDPGKLLELCRQRHHNGGVTLGWPCMLHIIEQLRRSNALIAKLEKIDVARGVHPHQQWADAKAALEEYMEASHD